jgi:hypothetical protein
MTALAASSAHPCAWTTAGGPARSPLFVLRRSTCRPEQRPHLRCLQPPSRRPRGDAAAGHARRDEQASCSRLPGDRLPRLPALTFSRCAPVRRTTAVYGAAPS